VGGQLIGGKCNTFGVQFNAQSYYNSNQKQANNSPFQLVYHKYIYNLIGVNGVKDDF
jgi:hypothetical protein